MKKFFGVLMGVLFVGSVAGACHGGDVSEGTSPKPGDKTQQYCLAEDSTACSFLWFQSHVDTKTEGKFIVRLTGTQFNVADFKAELWMDMGGHGHGSAPLKVSAISPDTFQIENAWFVMTGQWQVRIEFTHNGKLAQIIIPVLVTE